MALAVCEFCNKPFSSFGSKICAECGKEIDDAYAKVRRYLYQQPDKADFLSIVESTGVSEKALNFLIKKGYVEIRKKLPKAGRCRLCGAETTLGALCESCTAKMLKEQLTKNEERRREMARVEKMRQQEPGGLREKDVERRSRPPQLLEDLEPERRRTIPISYKPEKNPKKFGSKGDLE